MKIQGWVLAGEELEQELVGKKKTSDEYAAGMM